MKNFKSIIAGAALLFICVAANAADKTRIQKASQTDVLTTYIDDVSKGKTTGLDKMLAKDMQFNLKRGENVNTMDKIDVINALQNGTATTPLETKSTILQQDENLTKVKVEFKYDGYTRVDTVTITKLHDWQVTNVDSSYN